MENKPLIFDPELEKAQIEQLLKNGVKQVNLFEDQIKELASVTRVDLGNLKGEKGVWAYYSWSNYLVHLLAKEHFRALRLSRNKNLILQKEQEKFINCRIGIAGLNVGNAGAICIALEGGAEKMKFADNDVLELSNLNRFRASLSDLGVNKAVLSARQVYEIDPFYDIEVFDKGLSDDNIDKFLTEPKIDLLIEEMDNLKLKIKIREKARYYKVPVLMVTGNGPNVIIDVERFDIDHNLPLLNGRLKKEIIKKIESLDSAKAAVREKAFLARDFMGEEFLTQRLRDSFKLIGGQLAGIPQLAESMFLRGACLCYFTRSIVVGGEITSGRYYLNLDAII